MPTRNVVITDRQDALIGKLVSEGRYQNASEVLREGLRLLEETLERRAAELAGIRAGLHEALEQARDGHFADGEAEEVIRRAFSRLEG